MLKRPLGLLVEYRMTNLGAHVTISNGYLASLEKIKKMGGSSLQIFSSSPRSWSFVSLDSETEKAFIAKAKNLGVYPIYFHASYLVNLALPGRIAELSIRRLIHELKVASRLGIKGTIVHLGSFKEFTSEDGLPLEKEDPYIFLVSSLKEILEETPKETLFIIENAGTRKVGKNLAELSTIIEKINNPRVKICLDTCHLFATGYDLSDIDKLDEFVKSFDSTVGLNNLECFHLNDSKDPVDSGRDRHENIGRGTIGLKTFKLLLTHPKTKNYPFIIETPGFDEQGPDKKNLDILKSLLIKKSI